MVVHSWVIYNRNMRCILGNRKNNRDNQDSHLYNNFTHTISHQTGLLHLLYMCELVLLAIYCINSSTYNILRQEIYFCWTTLFNALYLLHHILYRVTHGCQMQNHIIRASIRQSCTERQYALKMSHVCTTLHNKMTNPTLL